MAPQPQATILNVDTGVDDALAILLALHLREQIPLVGIITVAGNTSAAQAALNTRFVLERFGCKTPIPVIAGAERSLRRGPPPTESARHGDDGLGGVTTRHSAGRAGRPGSAPGDGGAVDFLIDAARTYGAGLTVVSTAPLTNVALAIRKGPRTMARLGKFEIMGGAVDVPGAVNDGRAAFNVACDPEACREVLATGVPATLFPLDVTRRVRLLESMLTPALGLPETDLRLIREMTRCYMEFHRQRYGFHGCFVHDALPVAALADRSLFRFERAEIVVDCSDAEEAGRTRRTFPGEKGLAVEMATEVDEPRFFRLFCNSVRRPLAL